MIDYNHFKKYISAKYPDYQFSWEILTEIILQNLKQKPYWLDLGAGTNILIKEQPGASLAMGVDIQKPENMTGDELSPYCLASAYNLPFRFHSFDFITSRYAFEHLANPVHALEEIDRVLKPGGQFILQTTNKYSPLILVSRLIPFSFKKFIFRRVFKDNPSGTFKTFYKINRPSQFPSRQGELNLDKIILVEDILCQNAILFQFSFMLLKIVKLFKIESLSNNLIAIYCKAK